MKKLVWILLIAAPLGAQTTNYNPGTTATILNAVTTTGTGTCYAMLNQGAIPANFTWQTVISGGTASSITVVFEGSLNNDCSNPSTIDTSTSTSGETRSVANKAYPYVTANITAYSRNGTTATVNFVAQYGSGVPTPSASNLCFVSQGAFQGSWTWKACSGAGGTVSSFSSGDLTGLFTTSVATPTSTPALSFTPANFNAHTFWGNNTGSTAAGSAVQPACGDLSNAAASCATDATNPANLASAVPINKGGTNATTAAAALANLSTPGIYWYNALSSTSSAATVFTLNKAVLMSTIIPYPVTVGHIMYSISTADNSGNLYDLGLYNMAGNLVADCGATAGTSFAPGTGTQSCALAQGTITLPAGTYIIGYTGNATTAVLGNVNAGFQVQGYYGNSQTTTGGALASSVNLSSPGPTWQRSNTAPFIALYP